MICPTASAKSTMRALKLDTRGFRIINAYPAAGIGLEPLISRRESQNEVAHKRAGVNPRSQTAASYDVTIGFPQGEVSTAPEAVVKEVTFDGRTKYACAKDVTEFDSAVETGVIFRADIESVPKKWRIRIGVREGLVSAAVLIDIRPGVNPSVKTESVTLRRRRRRSVCDGFPGLQRSNGEPK